MKKLLALSLVVLLLAMTALPVLAASETAATPPGPFSMVGKIQSIDAATGTLTVKVYNGNYLVRPYRGQIVTINTTVTTRYFYKSSPLAIPIRITFADLKVGDPVSINGILANGVWTASRITVGASLSCFQ